MRLDRHQLRGRWPEIQVNSPCIFHPLPTVHACSGWDVSWQLTGQKKVTGVHPWLLSDSQTCRWQSQKPCAQVSWIRAEYRSYSADQAQKQKTYYYS